MVCKRCNRDENGKKLPWRAPGPAPGTKPPTAADTDSGKAWAKLAGRPYGTKAPLGHEVAAANAALRRLEKEAFPVTEPEKKLPNVRLMTDGQLLALQEALMKAERYDWRANARPEQLEPADYKNWLLMGGRGMGKTRTGAETVRDWVENQNMKRVAVIAKASRELRDVCFEGISGLLEVIPPDLIKDYRKGLGDTYIVLKNGARIIGFTAEAPDSIRGHAFDGIWGDEFAAWPKHLAADMYIQAWMTLRQAKRPRMILTTTPKRVPHLKDFLERAEHGDEGIVITKGKTTDNTALSAEAMNELYSQYGGTHMGRQELDGEMLTDVDGALWTPEMVDAARWAPDDEESDLPKFRKIICAVDPSGSANGDATGIVVVAYAGDRRIFVLGCYSTKGLAAHRYNEVCRAAERHGANEILYEGNFSGDNAALGIENQWKHLVQAGEITSRMPRIKDSTLQGNKAVKASPVAALYEQQMNAGISRIWHLQPSKANGLAKLEDELVTWAVKDKNSPNSLDALVIGARRCMRELGLDGGWGQAGPGRRMDDGWRPF